MKLSELKVGQTARVVSIDLNQNQREKLYKLGLTESVKVTLIRIAPLFDPIELKVRDFYLALRLSQANEIEVELE